MKLLASYWPRKELKKRARRFQGSALMTVGLLVSLTFAHITNMCDDALIIQYADCIDYSDGIDAASSDPENVQTMCSQDVAYAYTAVTGDDPVKTLLLISDYRNANEDN